MIIDGIARLRPPRRARHEEPAAPSSRRQLVLATCEFCGEGASGAKLGDPPRGAVILGYKPDGTRIDYHRSCAAALAGG